jgi:hypothetical protein
VLRAAHRLSTQTPSRILSTKLLILRNIGRAQKTTYGLAEVRHDCHSQMQARHSGDLVPFSGLSISNLGDFNHAALRGCDFVRLREGCQRLQRLGRMRRAERHHHPFECANVADVALKVWRVPLGNRRPLAFSGSEQQTSVATHELASEPEIKDRSGCCPSCSESVRRVAPNRTSFTDTLPKVSLGSLARWPH